MKTVTLNNGVEMPILGFYVYQVTPNETEDVFDFELCAEEMNCIKTLDTAKSLFLDHRDPETVKWLGNFKI